MKRLGTGLLALVSAFGCLNAAQAEELRVVANQYIVKFATKNNSAKAVTEKELAMHVEDILGGDSVLLTPIDHDSKENLRARDFVKFDPQVLEFCKSGVTSGVFESCSPNYEIRASENVQAANDPRLGELYGLQNIDAPTAWELSTGSANTVVAIIDSGVDYSHLDLAGNMWRNTAEIAGNGIDDDNDGYIDDIYGINAITNSGNPMDDNRHGTHVAGTIGAVGNNGVGVAGVNWNVKMMALKFLDANGSGTTADAIKAINYMVAMKNRGVNIRAANNSWGGGGFSQGLFDAISSANQAGILFVAAAGNAGRDNDILPSYPAGYNLPNVISVAAIDANNQLADFSNFGVETVDIGAPGVSILSTLPGNGYGQLSGTSMATPHVTGAIALLSSHMPMLTASQLTTRLYESGVETASLAEKTVTGRRLNVNRMLRSLVVTVPTPTPLACTYSVHEIPFSPNRSVENAAVLVDGDDASADFAAEQAINFFGSDVSSLRFSTNGVVYFTATNIGSDYASGETAPRNSLAAFHTDLLGSEPYGVRVMNSAGSVLFYYNSGHYSVVGSPSNDLASKVWGEILPSGTIRTYYEFSTPSYLNMISALATVGVRGPNLISAVNFSAQNNLIRNDMGLEFTQVCNGTTPATPAPTAIPEPPVFQTPEPTVVPVEPSPTPTVTPVQSQAIVTSIQLRSGTKSNAVVAGRKAAIDLRGNGTGQVEVSFTVDNKSCGKNVQTSLSDGYALFERKIPSSASKLHRINVSSGDVSTTFAVKQARKQARTTRAKAIKAVCNALTK